MGRYGCGEAATAKLLLPVSTRTLICKKKMTKNCDTNK